MKLDQSRMERALEYLSSTDEPAAELRANVERAEYKAKAIRDKVFLLEVGSVAERNANAGVHMTYVAAINDYFIALQESDAMRNKRTTEAIVIDCWRSINANRKQGSV